jgi:hypothetical protein
MSANSNPPPSTFERISVDEMRQKFNSSGYWEYVQSGKWTSHTLESRISGALPEETVEITSVMLSYHDENGNEMARVHQYQRPDGSIAASGKPDPKRLVQDGVLYRLNKSPKCGANT